MKKLYAPELYWRLTPEQRHEFSNGCGPGRGVLNFLIPDKLLGLSIHVACDIHDFMYVTGTTLKDKDEADRVFLNNMIRLIDDSSFSFLNYIRLRMAKRYYDAVHIFGGPAFWNSKNPPENEGVR
jgi:hypothetical protein